MKLAFPFLTLKHHGGVRMLVALMNHLARRGFRVVAAVPSNQFNPLYPIDSRVEIRLLRRSNETSLFSKLKALWLIYKALLEEEPDLIVANFFPTAYPAYFLRGRAKVLYVIQDLPQFFAGPKARAMLYSVRFPFRKIVVSNYLKEELGLPDAEVVPTGIEAQNFYPDPDPYLVQEKLYPAILYFPRSQIYKGYPVFLETVRILKDRGLKFEVWLVTKEEETLNEFERMDVPAFLMPARDDRELRRIYSSADVFVSSSLWEGLNLPPLEAMACGTPVAMTDSGGSREYARDGENALVVPPGDPEALADAVERLLRDEGLRKRLVKAGFETAKRFTAERFCRQVEAIIREMLHAP